MDMPAWFKQLNWAEAKNVPNILQCDIPKSPGCYMFTDSPAAPKFEKVLYIGRSVNLRRRVRGYIRPVAGKSNRFHKGKAFLQNFIEDNGGQALYCRWAEYGGDLKELESSLIWFFNPLFNDRYERYPALDHDELLISELIG